MNAGSTQSRKAGISASLVKREILILMLFGIIIFALTALFEGSASEAMKTFLKALQDLGLALIEAALVMAIIDRRTSREQIEQSLDLIEQATNESKTLIGESIEETKRAAQQSQDMTRKAIDSVFDSVYKKRIPHELIKHYESAVFRSNFFRRRNEFVYTLNVPEGAQPEDFIGINVHNSFIMENLTDEDLTFEFQCETSVVPNAPPTDLHQSYELRVNNMLQDVKPGQLIDMPGYQALVLKHRVPIPAGSTRAFEVTFETVRRLRDAEILMASWPSDGVTVSVIFPPSLDVSANSLHPISLDRVPTGKNSCKWSLSSGMVPGQGIFVAWEPRI